MNDEKASFESGDRVRIQKPPSAGQTGTVINILSMENKSGSCKLVWVRLSDGRVDGFSPASLEKLHAYSRLRAA